MMTMMQVQVQVPVYVVYRRFNKHLCI